MQKLTKTILVSFLARGGRGSAAKNTKKEVR